MARLLYREWFVDFRFPGHEFVPMVDSPFGPIPEGWRQIKVRDVVSRLKPGTVYTQSETSIDGKVPVVDQSRDERPRFHNNAPDHSPTPDQPVITFGDHTCKMELLTSPFSVGPNVVVFEGLCGVPVAYLYYLVESLVSTQEYKRHWNPLMSQEVICARTEVASRFGPLVVPLLELKETLALSNHTLRKTRDLLLPRLVSGEIDVEDLAINTEGLAA